MSEANKFTFFWSGPFSQWYPSPFTDTSLQMTFGCAEQWMMYHKAVFFADEETAEKIMKTSLPKEQKRLGRKVKNFHEKMWNDIARDIVYQGNFLKFRQNKNLQKLLLATAGTELVEASPYDKIWSCGLRESVAKTTAKENWPGKNWLGQILDEVRNRLQKA